MALPQSRISWIQPPLTWAFLFSFSSTAFAMPEAFSTRTLVVDDDKAQCPKAQYTKIQTAIDAARPSDRVQVCPGVYREQLHVTKPLTIEGVAQGGIALIQPDNLLANTISTRTGNPIAAIILVEGAVKITLQRLTIDGTNGHFQDCVTSPVGVHYHNASGWITNLDIRNIQMAGHLFGCQAGFGILIQSSAGHRSQVNIVQNSIHDYQKGGIVAHEPGTDVFINENAISGIGPTPAIAQNGVQIGYGATGTVEANWVSNHIYTPCLSFKNCPFAAANILNFEADQVVITHNHLTNSQLGIYYKGNQGRIQNNTVWHTEVLDGISIIGKSNRITDNTVKMSGSAGVSLFGTRNQVESNTISSTPIGVFEDTDGGGNRVRNNEFDNVQFTRLSAAERPTSWAHPSNEPIPNVADP